MSGEERLLPPACQGLSQEVWMWHNGTTFIHPRVQIPTDIYYLQDHGQGSSGSVRAFKTGTRISMFKAAVKMR